MVNCIDILCSLLFILEGKEKVMDYASAAKHSAEDKGSKVAEKGHGKRRS